VTAITAVFRSNILLFGTGANLTRDAEAGRELTGTAAEDRVEQVERARVTPAQRRCHACASWEAIGATTRRSFQ
jgi:hypothetical protein